MRIIRLIIYFTTFLGLMALGIMFGIENTQELTLTFFKFVQRYTFTVVAPLWIAVGGSFLAGAFLTIIVFSLELMRMHFQIRRLKKQLKQLGGYSAPSSNDTYSSEETTSSQYDAVEAEVVDHPNESEDIL